MAEKNVVEELKTKVYEMRWGMEPEWSGLSCVPGKCYRKSCEKPPRYVIDVFGAEIPFCDDHIEEAAKVFNNFVRKFFEMVVGVKKKLRNGG